MKQLTLPFIEDAVLHAVQITSKTSEIYNEFAKIVGLSEEELEKEVFAGHKAGMVSKWKRKIRFIQQTLKSKGFIKRGQKYGSWFVTKKGKDQLGLTHINPGLAKIYFVTNSGFALWAYAEDMPKIFKNEISLIITSPPYLLTKDKSYGNIGANDKQWVQNMLDLAAGWKDMLTPDGSIVLNIGGSYKKDMGYQNLHIERLLIALEDQLDIHLCQKFQWWNPCKMPTGHHVTKIKKHCVNAVEEFLWLSPNPKKAKANNQNVLVEYSEKHKKLILNQISRKPSVRWRPSDQRASDQTFYADNGGAIPHNILISAPEGANSKYSRFCKENKLPRHPAMFNFVLPEFFIKLLTNEGDFVFDPFLGSCTTGYAAQINNRYWGGSELIKQWLDGGKSRFLGL